MDPTSVGIWDIPLTSCVVNYEKFRVGRVPSRCKYPSCGILLSRSTITEHTFRNAPCLTTQYAPSFPLYSALVVIQLKDSMRTILQPAALGAGCGYHPIGYLKDDNFGYHAACPLDISSISSALPGRLLWR